MTTVSRQALVQEARSWLGTPYHHQARLKGVGVDCAGLPVGCARTLGLVAPDFDVEPYPRRPDGVTLIAHCDRWATRVELVNMAVGDMVVFKIARWPQHIGILADWIHGGFSVIHALGTADGKGRVVEHRLSAGFLDRFVAAYRLPGVAE